MLNQDISDASDLEIKEIKSQDGAILNRCKEK